MSKLLSVPGHDDDEHSVTRSFWVAKSCNVEATVAAALDRHAGVVHASKAAMSALSCVSTHSHTTVSRSD